MQCSRSQTRWNTLQPATEETIARRCCRFPLHHRMKMDFWIRPCPLRARKELATSSGARGGGGAQPNAIVNRRSARLSRVKLKRSAGGIPVVVTVGEGSGVVDSESTPTPPPYPLASAPLAIHAPRGTETTSSTNPWSLSRASPQSSILYLSLFHDGAPHFILMPSRASSLPRGFAPAPACLWTKAPGDRGGHPLSLRNPLSGGKRDPDTRGLFLVCLLFDDSTASPSCPGALTPSAPSPPPHGGDLHSSYS